jgi:Zn-dependent metalloprotease
MMTYDYFQQKHNRNSYNNQNAPLLGYVNANLTTLYGISNDNALWDGTRMTYGKGGSSYDALTALDVVAHEIGHGVNSSTANLGGNSNSGEPGALSEGFSDIWAACVENFAKPNQYANWSIGEDIALTAGGNLRSMSSPWVKGHPSTYLGNNWYTGASSSTYIHTNNGVLNYWFYLLTNGGSGTNDNGVSFSVQGIGA